jgi:hypothetical protein
MTTDRTPRGLGSIMVVMMVVVIVMVMVERFVLETL